MAHLAWSCDQVKTHMDYLTLSSLISVLGALQIEISVFLFFFPPLRANIFPGTQSVDIYWLTVIIKPGEVDPCQNRVPDFCLSLTSPSLGLMWWRELWVLARELWRLSLRVLAWVFHSELSFPLSEKAVRVRSARHRSLRTIIPSLPLLGSQRLPSPQDR